MIVLDAALYGFRGGNTGPVWSSPNWLGWRAGQVLRARGLPEPVGCRTSRGYSVRVTIPGNDRDVLVKFSGDKLDVVEVFDARRVS